MSKLLTACVFFAALVSSAAADSLVVPARQEQQSIAFDNWEIRQGLLDHSYMLIGRSREGEGHFWLNCDEFDLCLRKYIRGAPKSGCKYCIHRSKKVSFRTASRLYCQSAGGRATGKPDFKIIIPQQPVFRRHGTGGHRNTILCT